jgi:hypothetical protein
MNMTRREAVIKMAVLMGASVVGPRLLGRTFGTATPLDFSDADLALLDEIAETIIPATHIPGAKAAHTGAFIAMMVADCYTPRAHEAFRAGLTKLLNELDAEQRKYTSANRRKMDDFAAGLITDEIPPHYFRVIRELTILGYFSSEIGSTKAVRYLEVPGRYDGNVPYKKGDEWFI